MLVVSHDNHNYSNLTYAEAKALEPALQTFGEVIEIVKAMSVETGRPLGIIPETKSTDYATSEALVQELIAHGFTDPNRVVIQSFSSANLQMLHDTIMPQYGVDLPLAFLTGGMTNLEQIATYADIIAPHQSLVTEAGVAAAHAAGLQVVTWTILGTQAQIQRLIDMGVDGVFVDETNTARESLSNINGVRVVYGTVADDDVSGTTGSDLIYAMSGDDAISVGEGDDEAYGDGGDDVVDGGTGHDIFAFATGFGRDTITDFNTTGPDSDVLAFSRWVFADFDAVIASAAQVGADTVLSIDTDTALTLTGVQLASLAQDDFRFL